ncbi:MAG: SH3 domain-containing protein [Christensenellales bacterium]
MTFPAYGITVDTAATILLRDTPDGAIPQTGALKQINTPTPVRISGQETGANDQIWYLVENLNNGDAGYTEAYNVRIVSEQEAMTAVKTPEPTIAPIETPTPEPTPDPTPEPVPQELTEGDVYHYGYNTGRQVALREQANKNGKEITRLSAGTVIWVMQREGDWCYVRANSKDGYMMTEYVKLMGVEEEAAYIASIDDPETRPDPTAVPTPIPTDTPNPRRRRQPRRKSPLRRPRRRRRKVTATPIPTETPEITAEPTAVPTATPAPVQLSLYARVIGDGTPLRGNPSNQAYLQNILNKEAVVYIFQSQYAEDGMTWYLVQYSGQWGFVRADLVRVMGEEETAEYLAALEAAQATPTPMPQATPEPLGPDATSAYAKLIKDAVNLRRTPSASGTSLGRIAVNTLMLVTGTEYDGTYTWYQVNYNGTDGYVRSDMCQMLTIAELQRYLAEAASATPVPNGNHSGPSTTPNKNNNTSVTINGTPLQDLLPTDNSWSSGTGTAMPSYATTTPDPNATPTPEPVANPAALLSSAGSLTVSNVPAVSETGKFTVYGTATASSATKSSIVTATVEIQVEPTATPQQLGFVASAIAENAVQPSRKTVGQAVVDSTGHFKMDVTLPKPGEYIVEFASDFGASYANYGVTYDTGATIEPTAQPMPTAEPVKEEGGLGILPFIIGGLLIVVAAAVYGVYVYRRKTEEAEEEEADEDEDEEDDLRAEQLERQRSRYAQPQTPRAPQSPSGQVPSYMKNTAAQQPNVRSTVNPYMPKAPDAPTMPSAPKAPVAPTMPSAPKAPVAPTVPSEPKAPVAPTVPSEPKAPVAPTMPSAPKAPVVPTVPSAPKAPVAPTTAETPTASTGEAPRRRRRPPVDPNA